MISFLKDTLFGMYWTEIWIFTTLLILGFVLDQKFNVKKPRKWFLEFNGLICQRVFSVLAYYVPYLDVVNTYIPLIAQTHPFLVRLFLPNFVADSVDLVQKVPFLSFLYLMAGYGLLVRYKIPEDRLVRFNIMFGVIIISFQGILHEVFLSLTKIFVLSPDDISEAALFAFIFWILIFIPCFVRALSGQYDSNSFMREAIEVHLGRDGPDFIWWDRTRKDQAPKKPKS
uniref:hypothetical protein n=1 Tax=Halosiphon tomentosus TaxID=64927 RepID=UPI002E7A9C67|nr:hypothetical protein V2488_pgp040 [Halosiphon tomentosus]WAM63781.1 hypothetical protein [Halosiphon tomentosus]